MVFKLINCLLFLGIVSAAWIQNPSPLLSRPFDAKSTALGGINTFEMTDIPAVQFSYSSSDDEIFEESSIIYKKGARTFYLSYFGVSDLDNTVDAWSDNDDGIPSSDEIDYTRITSFDYSSISIAFSVQLFESKIDKYPSSQIEVWPTLSMERLYESSAYSFGISVHKKISYENIQISFFIHDIFSTKWWSTSRNEIYIPFIELIFNTQFNKVNLLTKATWINEALSMDVGIDYNLHENLSLRGGIYGSGRLSFGSSMRTELIEFEIAIVPADNSNPFKPSQQFSLKLYIDKVLSASNRLSP